MNSSLKKKKPTKDQSIKQTSLLNTSNRSYSNTPSKRFHLMPNQNKFQVMKQVNKMNMEQDSIDIEPPGNLLTEREPEDNLWYNSNQRSLANLPKSLHGEMTRVTKIFRKTPISTISQSAKNSIR